MRQPRTFTFHIYSSKRVSGTAGDYFVNLPGLDALVNGQERPDFYELVLNGIASTMVGTNYSPANAGGANGFLQLALDLPAPYVISNGRAPNVLFIAPVVGAAVAYQLDLGKQSSDPVIIAASGITSMLHVRLLDQAGAVLDATGHEHVITMTMREAYVRDV